MYCLMIQTSEIFTKNLSKYIKSAIESGDNVRQIVKSEGISKTLFTQVFHDQYSINESAASSE